MQGLLRAKPREEDISYDTVTILVLLSDGRPTSGETHRQTIAEDVYKLTRDGMVKIFSLGFQGSADMKLLDAIAIMNGGVSAPILHGTTDFASQMYDFFLSEFGTVLLSNVSVEVKGNDGFQVYGETQRTFPLLADGYEIVVRGLLDSEEQAKDLTLDFLHAVTTASTGEGRNKWETVAVESLKPSESKNSLCYQSYAHSRITQLLRLRGAAKFASDELLGGLVSLSKDCKTDMAECITEEALSLALEANVVVKDLTAMVTIDEEGCLSFEDESEICRDGTTSYGGDESEDGYPPPPGIPAHSHDDTYEGGSPRPGLSSFIFTIFCICFALEMFL